MKPYIFFCCLILAACDARDLSGPEEAAGPPVSIRKYEVAYRVEGTYASCDVAYADAAGETRTVTEVGLPVEISLALQLEAAERAYLSIRATCADLDRRGKSTAFLFVDGVLKDRDSAVGYGATSTAAYLIERE